MKTYLFVGSAFLVGWFLASYFNGGIAYRFATIAVSGELR
jgi:hypothetical protein